VLGEAPREFVKGASPNVAEAYEGAGLHAYYDSAGRLDLIEAFQPCSRVFAGIELLGDAGVVVASLRELGLVGREDGEGGIWFEDRASRSARPPRRARESPCSVGATTRARRTSRAPECGNVTRRGGNSASSRRSPINTG
jgi:hypothetical protein